MPMEVAYLGLDARIVLPGRGNESRHGLSEIEPVSADEELERVVEQRRVGAVRIERRGNAGLDPERAFPRLHPADVSVDRVDLTVVAEEPKRLGALPARLRVRREPLVEDRERHGERRILEVGKEARELAGSAQRLVRDREERQRRDVHAGDPLGTAACPVCAAFEIRIVGWREEQLLDPRHRRKSGHAESGGARRHGPPTRRLESLGAACILDEGAEPALAQEAHRDACAGSLGQRIGERQEDSGPITRDAVGCPCAAMTDGGEARERTVEHLARSSTYQRPQRGRCRTHRARAEDRRGCGALRGR